MTRAQQEAKFPWGTRVGLVRSAWLDPVSRSQGVRLESAKYMRVRAEGSLGGIRFGARPSSDPTCWMIRWTLWRGSSFDTNFLAFGALSLRAGCGSSNNRHVIVIETKGALRSPRCAQGHTRLVLCTMRKFSYASCRRARMCFYRIKIALKKRN